MPARRSTPPPPPPRPASELGALVQDVSSTMGEGVMVLADRIPSFTHVPFGNFILDFATLGGYPEHCGHLIYGQANCGKTTMCLRQAAALQRKYPDMEVVWVDVEKKFDKLWAQRHGVDLSRIHIVRPPRGEKAVDIIEAAAKANDCSGVFLDSIAGLTTKDMLEKSADDKTMAERARLVGLLCSKMQQLWIDELQREHIVTGYFINQFREAIGQFSPHGTPTTLPGGKYQHYMVDTKLEVKAIKEEVSDVGGFATHRTTKHAFKFHKSKAGFSIKTGEYEIVMDDHGREDGLVTGEADDFLTLVTYAKKMGVLTGGGNKWRLNGIDTVFPNRDAIITRLKRDPEASLRVRRLCIMIKRSFTKVPLIPPDRYLLAPVSLAEAEELEGAVTTLLDNGDALDAGDE